MKSVALKIDANFNSSYGHLFTLGDESQILACPGEITFVYMLTTTLKKATEASQALSKLCEPYEIT